MNDKIKEQIKENIVKAKVRPLPINKVGEVPQQGDTMASGTVQVTPNELIFKIGLLQTNVDKLRELLGASAKELSAVKIQLAKEVEVLKEKLAAERAKNMELELIKKEMEETLEKTLDAGLKRYVPIDSEKIGTWESPSDPITTDLPIQEGAEKEAQEKSDATEKENEKEENTDTHSEEGNGEV